ncbi:carboxylesterase family domain-containing protein [Ditylenchus destructor]|nr:carboxylesterase family domain-containing protein [Ditylenchus destructor]
MGLFLFGHLAQGLIKMMKNILKTVKNQFGGQSSQGSIGEDQSEWIGFIAGFEMQNRGLYDLLTALKWINNHIRRFNGNNTSVTIGGVESGAGLVSLLAQASLHDVASMWH